MTQKANNRSRYRRSFNDSGLASVAANDHQRITLQRAQTLTADSVCSHNGVEVEEIDLLFPSVKLPLRASFYPLGFPLDIFSNSPAVIAAAEESWKHFQPKFMQARMEVHVTVRNSKNDNTGLPNAPACYMQPNIMLCVADADNLMVSDFNHSRSFGFVAKATVDAPLYLRYYFLEAAALATITSLHAVPIHGACVCPLGSGMLFCGDSGAGKSSLAYAGARAGWTFISDDASYLLLGREEQVVIGNAHKIRFRRSSVNLFPELEGRPITPRAAGKPSIEVPTAELKGLKTSESATIQYIVFLNRRSTGADELIPLSRSLVLPWFRKSITPAAQSRAAQCAALDRLLSVPIFEFRYRDLDRAVERLERLAATGR